MKPLLHFDAYINDAASNRLVLQRIFFTLALISLLFDVQFNMLLHQIGRNPLLYQEIDPVYWLFMLLNLPDVIGGQYAFLFDVLLLASCCCCIIWPRKMLFTLSFFILHFIYFILYNMFSGHHYISIGLLFMSFPFVWGNKKHFAYTFLFMRFAFCFMMFTAALWKIARGNLFYKPQLYQLFVIRDVNILATGKGDLRFWLVQWLLQHPFITHLAWVFLIALEFVFVLGFVSFKWDRILLISYLLFYIGGWLLLNIYNYDNLLFLLTLTPVLHGVYKLSEFYKRKQTFTCPSV